MIQKAFKIGNSIAITIPKEANIASGTKLKFTKRVKNSIIYEVVEEPAHSIKEKVETISGGFDIEISTQQLQEILNYLEENPYEKDASLS